MSNPDAKRLAASRKLEKLRLLRPDITLSICADHREAGCASASELKASWKHLKRAAKKASRGEPTVAAVPLQCIDVCKFGPLMSVSQPGQPTVWVGRCTPDVIDTVLDALLAGEPIPTDHVLGEAA